MTKALDAAVRAAEEAIEDPKRYAKYEDVACAVLRAALPAEPTPELLEAMRQGALASMESSNVMAGVYRALRAHLLGEDA